LIIRFKPHQHFRDWNISSLLSTITFRWAELLPNQEVKKRCFTSYQSRIVEILLEGSKIPQIKMKSSIPWSEGKDRTNIAWFREKKVTY
jgi:hypothetical protein